MFNLITGVFAPTRGAVRFKGQDLLPGPPGVPGCGSSSAAAPPVPDHTAGHRSHLPEHPAVREHDRARERHGRDRRAQPQPASPGRCCGRPAQRSEERRHAGGAVRSCSSSSGSGGTPTSVAKNLAYGDQRRLEIARAMGTDPALLMLDEPAAGMNPAEKAALMRPDPAGAGPGDHGAADRARHEGGHGHLRPGRGAGLRREDRRGRAAGGPADPRVIEAYLGSGRGARRRSASAGRRLAARIRRRTRDDARGSYRAARRVHIHYGGIEAVKGVDLARRRGRDRHPHRRQRRRQDHHAEDHLGAEAADGRHDPLPRAARSTGCRRTAIVRMGIGHAPGGPADLRAG